MRPVPVLVPILALAPVLVVGACAADASGSDGGNGPGPVFSTVVVSPETPSLAVGATLQFSVGGRDTKGDVMDIAGRAVAWSSTNTGVLTIDGSGLATAVTAGEADVRATVSGITGSSRTRVTAPIGGGGGTTAPVAECASPRANWIWCDDFEQDRLGSYFEVNTAGGRLARAASTGRSGSQGLRQRFVAGQEQAGDLSLAFGRTPDAYMRPVDAGTANYRELYWRFFVRTQPGWTGGAGWKLSRAIIFANAAWAEALVAHAAGYTTNTMYLILESGTDAAGTIRTTRYNDFDNFRYLGDRAGAAPIYATRVGEWVCVEAHVRLNDAGASNGVFESWVDGTTDVSWTGLNLVGSYSAYGLNALFFNAYWNNGAPQSQERYLDNIVVSTQRIGC